MNFRHFSFNELLSYALVWGIICLSGGVRFGKVSIIMFFFLSVFAYIKNNKGGFSSYNVGVITALIGWILLNNYFFIPKPRNAEIWRFLIFSSSMFFVISSFNFQDFKNKIYSCFNLLCWISIIVQVACRYLNIISYYYTYIDNHRKGMCMYFFNVAWGAGSGNIFSYDIRLSSIYWEPGQFQIVAFFILVLFIDDIIILEDWRRNLMKFASIIICILLSFSTTGYLVLGLLIFYVIIFNSTSMRYKILFPLFLVAGFAFYHNAIYKSDVVQRKFSAAEYDGPSSYQTRVNDNVALFKISNKYPITGVGLVSSKYRELSERYEARTTSNGWLVASASNGYPYLCLLLILMCLGIKRMKFGLPILCTFSILFVSQCNEWSAATLPYIYMYIFKYKSYKKLRKTSSEPDATNQSLP